MIAKKFLYNIRVARVIQISVVLINSSPPRKPLEVVQYRSVNKIFRWDKQEGYEMQEG